MQRSMNLHPGVSLKSISTTDDPHFQEAIIFITEYNEKGAMGFITNKLFPRTLNDLVEFKTAPAFPLHYGGPMGEEQLFFIHQRPDLINGGVPINETVYFGGDFKEAVRAITHHKLSTEDLVIFIGYCGWDPGQPEEEILAGGWEVVKGSFGGIGSLKLR